MKTSELKAYIEQVLGNNIRCLLPSYWWKRLFGLVVDQIEGVEKVASDAKEKVNNMPKEAIFYLAESSNGESLQINKDSLKIVNNYRNYTVTARLDGVTPVQVLAYFNTDEGFVIITQGFFEGYEGSLALSYLVKNIITSDGASSAEYFTSSIPMKVIKTSSLEDLDPNIYYKFDGVKSNLRLSFNTNVVSDVLNNYMFEFTASSSGCTLSLPSDVKWSNGVTPVIEASKTYQVSIINNLAVVSSFS